MAIKNRKANLPIYRIHSESEFRNRAVNDKAQPRHVIASIVMHPEILVQVHTAGRDTLWSLPVRQAAINRRLIRGMCSEDALSVGVWYGEAQQRRIYQEMAKEMGGNYIDQAERPRDGGRKASEAISCRAAA